MFRMQKENIVQQIKPQGANALAKDKWEKYFNDPNYIAEKKFDGSRYILQTFVNANPTLTSRRESVKGGMCDKTLNVPHIVIEIRKLGSELVLDGEIDIRGDDRNFKYVQSVMGSLYERAIAIQYEKEKLVYKVFDILEYNGKNLRDNPLYRRRSILEQLFTIEHFEYIILVEQYKDKKKLYEEEIKRNAEGIMLKNINSIYIEDKSPSQTWYKIKRESTYDGIVKSYKFGTVGTKYEKWLGTLTTYQYKDGILIETAEIGGLTEQERIEFKEKLDKGETLIIEFKAQETIGDHRYRHPSYLRIRTDKNPEQCIYGKS